MFEIRPDRQIPQGGHWEGDLIIGKNQISAIATLVERSTRYTILVHFPRDHGGESVRNALVERIAELSTQLRRSLTWDQGSEMGQHSPDLLARVANELNTRPRKALGWYTPAERFARRYRRPRIASSSWRSVGSPASPFSVKYTRHARSLVRPSDGKRSSPSNVIVGEPAKGTAAASCAVRIRTYSTSISWRPSESRAWRARAPASVQFGQASMCSTYIFRARVVGAGSVIVAIAFFEVLEDLERGLDVAAPCLDPFTDRKSRDDERSDRVGPHPTEKAVQQQADEDRA